MTLDKPESERIEKYLMDFFKREYPDFDGVLPETQLGKYYNYMDLLEEWHDFVDFVIPEEMDFSDKVCIISELYLNLK